ncbi:hypothetical protein Bca52824_023796 [Brassica carinata]|uniref:Uncharacterized protein n=1 Tax=Brassica carinata TaxID=52824 RepID=A0A8X7VIY8_BRACI|nr:hypothetical protein Bca52824_023796 [Brassica carinata]
MSQMVRIAKRHESPKVVSCQRMPVTKRARVARQSVGKPFGWAWAVLGLRGSRPGLDQELRMVVVKPRSREDSISERLCSVWLDNIREELVIVYETVNKLCIGSHVSK